MFPMIDTCTVYYPFLDELDELDALDELDELEKKLMNQEK